MNRARILTSMRITMKGVGRVLGFAWASPITLAGLAYAGTFAALGWYRLRGWRGDALVYSTALEGSPRWLRSLWNEWGGHAIGNVVVVKHDLNTIKGATTLTHEQQHVRQCMILGVFEPIMYVLSMLTIWLACPNCNAYRDCVFEIDARRRAGQE